MKTFWKLFASGMLMVIGGSIVAHSSDHNSFELLGVGLFACGAVGLVEVALS